MRIIMTCLVLFCFINNNYSQDTELQFFPGTDKFYPYVNSISSNEGLKQYYFNDSDWVQNNSIPKFEDKNKFKNIGMQYIPADTVNAPQLFVYSKSSGDFSFYYLADNGWKLNEFIPSGKINLGSKNLTSKYTPPNVDTIGYIFSYTSDGSKLELLEIKDNGWSTVSVFPKSLNE